MQQAFSGTFTEILSASAQYILPPTFCSGAGFASFTSYFSTLASWPRLFAQPDARASRELAQVRRTLTTLSDSGPGLRLHDRNSNVHKGKLLVTTVVHPT